MKLEIAIHCYNYQRRLNWMLSSILHQEGDMPEIEVSISYEPNNGNPTTEKVIDFFRGNGLNIIDLVLNEGEGSCRSIARNQRLENTTADWILFADSDLVYCPKFFSELKKCCESKLLKNETMCIGADRHSLADQFCIDYFEKDKREYPCIIQNVCNITEKFPVKRLGGGGIAAGYFQLANVKSVRDRGIIYSGRNRDHWRSTKSDREFRIRMGGRVSLNGLCPNHDFRIYHLNHDRGGPYIQR